MAEKIWTPESLTVAIITSPRPERYVSATIESLFQTGPEVERLHDIVIVSDDKIDDELLEIEKKWGVRSIPRNQEELDRISGMGVHRKACDNYFRTLTLPEEGYQALVVCEDDIIFRDGWLEMLCAALNEMEKGGISNFLLSAYTADPLAWTLIRRGIFYSCYVPGRFFGTQCVVVAASRVGDLGQTIREFGAVQGKEPYDILLRDFCESSGTLYATRQSLVQHVGNNSTGLGGFHHISSSFNDRWPKPKKLVNPERVTSKYWILYRRGFDHRIVGFSSEGVIDHGATRDEVFWDLREGDKGSNIYVMSEFTDISRLTEGADGIWRGKFVALDEIDVELHPIMDRPSSGGLEKSAFDRERLNSLSEAWLNVHVSSNGFDPKSSMITVGAFRYIRSGMGERELRFGAHGKISAGAARCEKFWALRFSERGVELDILDENYDLTCSLSRSPDGSWEGQWVRFECNAVRLERSDSRRTLIIQHADGSHRGLLELTASFHSSYATKHNFNYWCLYGAMQFERSSYWTKIVLIRQALLAGYDLVIWMDADTLVVDPELDLRAAFSGIKNVGMCRHPMSWGQHPWHYNAGVIFCRNNPATVEYFERVWKSGADVPETTFPEQDRLMQCWEETPDLVDPVDNRWNTNWCCDSNEPVIRGWHGEGNARYERMKEELQRVAPQFVNF